MNSQSIPSHVAILVPSVRKAANYLAQLNFKIGPEEVWDAEGTKEIYVERDKVNSLLLMEPTKPGAYQKALDKRGPGLHHLAIDVVDLEGYLDSLAGTGWLLHPKSIKTMKQARTAYLARPGFPGLIEVQAISDQAQAKQDLPALFVEQISLKMDRAFEGLLQSVGLKSIVTATDMPSELTLAGKRIPMAELIGQTSK